jgi:hypothetical protein
MKLEGAYVHYDRGSAPAANLGKENPNKPSLFTEL